jgi:hypothetical protein
MGDFIRYIITAGHDLTLETLNLILKEVDPEFSIIPDRASTNSGDLLHGSEVYGEIELNRPGDQVFVEDLEDLRDELVDIEGEEKDTVLRAFDDATGMIALELSEAGHEHYRRIDPVWDWLFEHYPGLLQIDEEGYYDQDNQLLSVE